MSMKHDGFGEHLQDDLMVTISALKIKIFFRLSVHKSFDFLDKSDNIVGVLILLTEIFMLNHKIVVLYKGFET